MNEVTVQRMTTARIPTEAGEFQLAYYSNNRDKKEHMALIFGDVAAQDGLLVRVHSECFTGDVLGSMRCDCGPQLARAMQMIAAEGAGAVVYLRQEGRGIGLLEKLKAYNLQDEGYDTVEANLMLGHQADGRDYTVAALILRDLGVDSVRLLTNNPAKVEGLERLGVSVRARVALETAVHPENITYLATKVKRLRHQLNLKPSDPAITSSKSADSLNQSGVPAQKNSRPHITLTYAQSLDGSIAAYNSNTQTHISGKQSLAMTHQLRADHQAILVGIGTVLADDPSLTVRFAEGSNPQPVILDSQLRFPLDAKLLKNGALRPWIATTETADPKRQAALEEAGARVIWLPADSQGQVDLSALMQTLNHVGIENMMVEGGASVITSFLKAQLVDQLVLTIAPMMLGGLKAVGRLAQNGTAVPFPHLHAPRYEKMGDDLVLLGDVVWQ